MSEELFFAVKTIGLSKRLNRIPQTLLQAVNHNRRETQKERGSRSHIDPTRSHLNRRIAGPALPADVVALAKARMAGVGYKPLRHDYTQAYELLFSLPAGTSIDTTAYFAQCLQWAVAQFGLDNILSADKHHDESAPHLHILVLPMAGNLYQGSKLIEKVRLGKLRDSFAKLALSFGLKEPTRRLHGAMKETAARMVLAHLESTQDAILQSVMWFTAKQDIERNPARYVAALGLVLPVLAAPVKKVKTFRDIALSTGKGPKVERAEKPIGFENYPEKIETIPVLVSAPKPPPQATPKAAPPPTQPPAARPPEHAHADVGQDDQHDTTTIDAPTFTESVRERDDDHEPARYDYETGAYVQRPPPPARNGRRAADGWVTASLARQSARQTSYHRTTP